MVEHNTTLCIFSFFKVCILNMSYEYNEITLERDIFKRPNFLTKKNKKIETKDTVKTSFYFCFFHYFEYIYRVLPVKMDIYIK